MMSVLFCNRPDGFLESGRLRGLCLLHLREIKSTFFTLNMIIKTFFELNTKQIHDFGFKGLCTLMIKSVLDLTLNITALLC